MQTYMYQWKQKQLKNVFGYIKLLDQRLFNNEFW